MYASLSKETFNLSSAKKFNKSRFNSIIYSFKREGSMKISGFNSRVEDAELALGSIFKSDNKVYGSKSNDYLLGSKGDDLIHGGDWKKSQ